LSPGDAAHQPDPTKETGRGAVSSPGKPTTGDKPQQVVHGTTPKSPKRLARIAGDLYLLVTVFGGAVVVVIIGGLRRMWERCWWALEVSTALTRSGYAP
jgi:hypothetical protein